MEINFLLFWILPIGSHHVLEQVWKPVFLALLFLLKAFLKIEKFKALVGARYRNNSLFLNSSDLDANFNPNFTDVQTYLSYDFSERFSLDFLGSYSMNNYDFTPRSRANEFWNLVNPYVWSLIIKEKKRISMRLFRGIQRELSGFR